MNIYFGKVKKGNNSERIKPKYGVNGKNDLIVK